MFYQFLLGLLYVFYQASPYHTTYDQAVGQILDHFTHPTHAYRLPVGTSKNHWSSLCFCIPPPKGGTDTYRPILTLIEKPFKNLVKMNKSALWPSASPSPARSGPRRPSPIPRGPPSKNIGIPCVSDVSPLGFHWWPRSPGWCTDTYRPILTLIEKPL